MPDHAGLYFAKTKKEGWWDLIVDVQGKSPMLYISHAYYRGGLDPRIVQMKPFEIAEWGKEIVPE